MKIRTATMDDLKDVSKVEALCFPKAEAASERAFKDRLTYYPNHFWLLHDGDRLVSFLNGMVTDEEHLSDEMYENASMHNENGKWQMIFGVNTIPEYRRRGCAEKIINRVIFDAKDQGRKGIVLTCKDKMVQYYEKFGFLEEGLSNSEHGGEIWYEMRLVF